MIMAEANALAGFWQISACRVSFKAPYVLNLPFLVLKFAGFSIGFSAIPRNRMEWSGWDTISWLSKMVWNSRVNMIRDINLRLILRREALDLYFLA